MYPHNVPPLHTTDDNTVGIWNLYLSYGFCSNFHIVDLSVLHGEEQCPCFIDQSSKHAQTKYICLFEVNQQNISRKLSFTLTR